MQSRKCWVKFRCIGTLMLQYQPENGFLLLSDLAVQQKVYLPFVSLSGIVHTFQNRSATD